MFDPEKTELWNRYSKEREYKPDMTLVEYVFRLEKEYQEGRMEEPWATKCRNELNLFHLHMNLGLTFTQGG